MGSIDNRLEQKKQRESLMMIRIEEKYTNQCVLDVHHAWRAMCSRREHNRYWISNKYNWHIQHENLKIDIR